MSYILDALKKSDRERQDNSGPTLQTLQRPIRESAYLHSRLILQLVIVILLLLLALAALWIVYFSAFETTANSTATASDSAAFRADNEIDGTVDNSDNEQVPAPGVIGEAPAPLIPFWQLPAAVQQEIPALTFSLHIYAENPKRRTIIINKNRMTEGDRVLPELLLESITTQGVILNWKKAYRFSIDVVEAW
ncbi:MAG: general secretion pathway protein B [Paraglaciecola psychrophila]|jgi:general secretion pathway protein B